MLYGLTAPITEQQIEGVESYYLTWWNGGMAVKMVMHVVVRSLTQFALPAACLRTVS